LFATTEESPSRTHPTTGINWFLVFIFSRTDMLESATWSEWLP